MVTWGNAFTVCSSPTARARVCTARLVSISVTYIVHPTVCSANMRQWIIGENVGENACPIHCGKLFLQHSDDTCLRIDTSTFAFQKLVTWLLPNVSIFLEHFVSSSSTGSKFFPPNILLGVATISSGVGIGIEQHSNKPQHFGRACFSSWNFTGGLGEKRTNKIVSPTELNSSAKELGRVSIKFVGAQLPSWYIKLGGLTPEMISLHDSIILSILQPMYHYYFGLNVK